jgi:hypothetical protein
MDHYECTTGGGGGVHEFTDFENDEENSTLSVKKAVSKKKHISFTHPFTNLSISARIHQVTAIV